MGILNAKGRNGLMLKSLWTCFCERNAQKGEKRHRLTKFYTSKKERSRDKEDRLLLSPLLTWDTIGAAKIQRKAGRRWNPSKVDRRKVDGERCHWKYEEERKEDGAIKEERPASLFLLQREAKERTKARIQDRICLTASVRSRF